MFQDIRQPRRSLKEVLPRRQTSIVARFPKPPHSNRSGLFIFLLTIVFVVIGAMAISSLFSGAKVFVTPQTADLTFDKTTVNYAPVESMIFTPISESTTLVATGEEKVSEKATGQVIIYNNYSPASQKLIATTRLESKAGKIYRLVEAVTVPGQKTVSGQVTPGSVEAKIIADATGDSYNSSLTDFTIPGFKGGPRYDQFYARSKTPIAGGLIGNRPVVAEADKNKAVQDLHTSLTQKLLTQSRAQIPESFILYDDATNFEFTDKLVVGNGTSSRAILTTTIGGTAYLLEENRLTAKLSESQPKNNLSGLTIILPDIRHLDIKISATNQATTTKDKVLKLIVTGKTKAIAQVDVTKLVIALADQPQSQAGAIFNQMAEIQNAKVSLFPPWLRRFPQESAKIKIVLLPTN